MEKSRPTNPVTMRDAERLVKAARRVLLSGGYPNPERVGCPGSEVLKGLAERTINLADAKDWVLHLGCCSPCFIEYTGFQKQVHRRKTLELAFASVAFVAIILGGVWMWKAHRFPGSGGNRNVPTVAMNKPVTLDLRNWIVFRGEQPPSVHSGPVHLPRARIDLTVLLPVGSEAGNYEVQVSTDLGKRLVTGTGPAVIRSDGVTVLRVKIDDSNLKPGTYVLGIGEIGSEANKYPLEVK
jgi:hypothetical protein